MNNQRNPYEELYEHIKAFEDRIAPTNDDDLDDFIARIKQQVLLRQIASYKRRNPPSA